MKKMKTLFVMDYSDPNKAEIINEINAGCEWVFEHGIPTRKLDGSACMIKNGFLYKRYDAKINRKTGKRKKIPAGAIPCQPKPDPITGHFPHWVKVDFELSENKYHLEGYKVFLNEHKIFTNKNSIPIIPLPLRKKLDGTYELVGPKINGNKDNSSYHMLVLHGLCTIFLERDKKTIFEDIKYFLKNHMIEGIVFHHKTDKTKMCKIRRKDFGFEW